MVNPDIQILGDFDEKVVQVIEQFKLNQRQQFAFHIGAQRFKELLEIDVSSGNGTIGPGGTGKTHVVKALKELMKLYGSAHRIRFLAPTGTAAALIDGQTIHSALGIPVHLTNAEMRDHRDSNGADLKIFPESTIIVHRNITCQHLNKVKADSLTSSSLSPKLIRCTAKHTIGKQIVTAEVQNHLEQISTADGLPPHLDLYIGAPVVLRNRNISQELRITNGAQGIVRGILKEEMSPDSSTSYAMVALVEFESSPVKLSHLPTGYFPITPISSRIRASMHNPLTNSSFSILAMRHQLPIQLAFAITSHGAQGKTLSHVT